jgi:nuclear cap-binding protein subunit 1
VFTDETNANRLDELTLPDLHPKKAFIKAALDREIRLSFAKRVRSTVPEEIQLLIPERLDKDESPEFKFENPRKHFRLRELDYH